MLRDFSIAVILFSSTISFGQNSEIQVKNVQSAVADSKDGIGKDSKIIPREEYVGTKPNKVHPDSLQIMIHDPLEEKKGRKTPSIDKNNSKPD